MIDAFELHDRVMLKKPHACGENLWEITRVGADIKLKCEGRDPPRPIARKLGDPRF